MAHPEEPTLPEDYQYRERTRIREVLSLMT